MSELAWLPDSENRPCPDCGSETGYNQGIHRVMQRPDPIIIGDGQRRCSQCNWREPAEI